MDVEPKSSSSAEWSAGEPASLQLSVSQRGNRKLLQGSQFFFWFILRKNKRQQPANIVKCDLHWPQDAERIIKTLHFMATKLAEGDSEGNTEAVGRVSKCPLEASWEPEAFQSSDLGLMSLSQSKNMWRRNGCLLLSAALMCHSGAGLRQWGDLGPGNEAAAAGENRLFWWEVVKLSVSPG